MNIIFTGDNFLTPQSRVLLEQLTVPLPVKKFLSCVEPKVLQLLVTGSCPKCLKCRSRRDAFETMAVNQRCHGIMRDLLSARGLQFPWKTEACTSYRVGDTNYVTEKIHPLQKQKLLNFPGTNTFACPLCGLFHCQFLSTGLSFVNLFQTL